MPFRKLPIAILLALGAARGDAQLLAKKVATMGTCAKFLAPLTQFTDPQGFNDFEVNFFLAGTPATFPGAVRMAQSTLTEGPLFAGTCANPVANPAGRIGDLTSECSINTYVPIVVGLEIAILDPTLADLQATCAAVAATTTASMAAGVTLRACRDEVGVVGNTPQSKIPGSTVAYDYTPTVTYTAIGGFQDLPFTAGAGALVRRVCILWPNVTATAKPAGGTGKLAKNVVGSVSVAMTFTNAPAAADAWQEGIAGVYPVVATLRTGPLRQATYAETVTLNYRKPYLNWNQL